MGQATSGVAVSRSSSNSGGTNNLPPLLFHNVHGENIRISRDGTIAKRVESFCKGIAFSSRPIKVNEKIYIKFLEISNNWSGVIRFGFTFNDPSGTPLRYGLPKYACPDLTNKPGYWAKALNERFCSQGTILFYYVTSNGDVHFGINGEEKGIFFSGVDTRGPLWALIDVYGNSTAIEFLDIRHNLNNSRRYTNNCSNGYDDERIVYPSQPIHIQQRENEELLRHSTAIEFTDVRQQINNSRRYSNNCSNGLNDVDRIVYPMQQIHIQQQQQQQQQQPQQQQLQSHPQRDTEDLSLPLLRYQSPHLTFNPLLLHRTRGRNVRIGNGRNIASRTDNEICQGYVFTARPLQLGERVVVQILANEPMFQGCLGLGLTSCDPAALQSSDLPDDSNFLLDRPEYWVISRDFARNLNKGDEISFCISANGEVQFSRNGESPLVIIHVDHTLRLWAFFDIFGSTQRIRVMSCPAPVSPARSVIERRIISPVTQNSVHNQNLHNSRPSQHNVNYNSQPIQVPSTTSNIVAPVQISTNLPTTTGTMISTCSSTYVEPVSDTSSYSTPLSWAEQNGASVGTGTECTICYENSIDAVLYMCGHMCMCYECALQQWRGKGGGHCPLCRAVIRDVIRIYKS